VNSEISFEALRRVQLEEKKSPGLMQLGDDFYSCYNAFLREQEERLRKEFSLEAASTHESTRRVLRDVWYRRQNKLSAKALLDARAGERNCEGLACEEQRLYNALLTLFREGEASFLQGTGPAVGNGAEKEKPAAAEAARFRMLVDLPQFVGPDGQSHGPFKADEIVELPASAASLLEKRGAAQALTQTALVPQA